MLKRSVPENSGANNGRRLPQAKEPHLSELQRPKEQELEQEQQELGVVAK